MSMSKIHRTLTRSRGSSLIEVLISMFVFAVGLLGVASMQTLGLKATANSTYMGFAVSAASNMADMMLSNPQAIRNGDFNNVSAEVSASSCNSECTPSQVAQADIYDWQQSLIEKIPDAAATIASNGASGLFTIEISWTERGKEEDETKSHSITFLPYNP